MPEKLRFDPYLNNTNSEFLQAIAKVWAGKGKRRKEDCISAITQSLKNPEIVENVIAQLKPFERLALELAKEAEGEIDAENLLLMLRLLAAEGLPEFHKDYEADQIAFAKYLIKRGIFLCNAPLNSYHYGYSYFALTLFTDERLLTYIGKPSFRLFPLQAIPEPKITTFRRPTSVVLNILGMLQAIEQQEGFKVTQKGTLQISSLKKFLKSQNWQEESIEVDGFIFPEPANAFAFAFLRSGLLIPEYNNLILGLSIEEFAKASPQEQIGKILYGLVESGEWTEWRDSGWYNRQLYSEARQILLLALQNLPQAGRDWILFDDFEQILFNRLGEYFSLDSKPQYPRVFGNEPKDEYTALQKWRTQLRQNWISDVQVWLKYALSTWLYYLGLVELGLEPSPLSTIQNETVVSFRLTDLGRSLLFPQLAESIEVNNNTIKQAWIVQPNFEVMVYLEDINPVQLALLERHGERIDVQQHIARYRLTRDSVYKGWENGSSFEEFMAALMAGSKVNLPQNVEVELQQWGNLREQITLHKQAKLLEFPDEQTRESAFKKGLVGKPMGDRFVLVGELTTAKPWISERIDYTQPLPRCLSITEDGVVTLQQSIPDLLIHDQLNRWMEVQADGIWQLTRTSVSNAVKAGAKAEQLMEFLQSRWMQGIPPLLSVAIQAWASKAATVEIDTVLVLRCTNSTVFKAIATSPKLAPYLLGQLAPDILLVDERQYADLESELQWAGLKISETLKNVPKIKET